MLFVAELFGDLLGEWNRRFTAIVGAKSVENQKRTATGVIAWKMSNQLGDQDFGLIVRQMLQGRFRHIGFAGRTRFFTGTAVQAGLERKFRTGF